MTRGEAPTQPVELPPVYRCLGCGRLVGTMTEDWGTSFTRLCGCAGDVPIVEAEQWYTRRRLHSPAEDAHTVKTA